jgi:hypothetical protein
LDKSYFDTKAQAANPQAMSTIWPEGTELLIHVSCTGNPSNGLDYYDFWGRTVLKDQATVYMIDELGDFTEDVVGTKYFYSFKKGTPIGRVAWNSGTTNYWNIGKLPIFPRQAAADFDMYLSHDTGTLASVTDASTWVDTAGEVTGNVTFGSHTDERLSLKMIGANANLGWGRSQLIVMPTTGQLKEYYGVAIMSTDCLGIGVAELEAEGWMPITTGNLYNEKAFYKILYAGAVELSGTMFPAQGSKAKWELSIPIVTTNAATSTEYVFKFYLADMANPSSLAIGTDSTTMPTAYGMVTAYGIGARIQNTAFTISSGAAATEQLRTYVTTAS